MCAIHPSMWIVGETTEQKRNKLCANRILKQKKLCELTYSGDKWSAVKQSIREKIDAKNKRNCRIPTWGKPFRFCFCFGKVWQIYRQTDRQTHTRWCTMGNSMPTTYNPHKCGGNGSGNGDYGNVATATTTMTTATAATTQTSQQRQHTSTLGGRSQKSKKNDSNGPENSRVLFLLYLIHRTWNIMVETVDPKSKRYYIVFVHFVLFKRITRSKNS